MTTTTTQPITEGATVTIAGRNFTVDTIYSHIVLIFAQDTGKAFAIQRNSARPVRVTSLGADLRKNGNRVMVRTAGDQLQEV